MLIGMASFGYGTLTALLVLFLTKLPGAGRASASRRSRSRSW
jgi:hypothetical protein